MRKESQAITSYDHIRFDVNEQATSRDGLIRDITDAAWPSASLQLAFQILAAFQTFRVFDKR
jgi:hypothetical protein